MNVFQAYYLFAVAKLPAPSFYANTAAWASIFALVPGINAASIIAEVVSELIDTEVYHFWKENFGHWPQWTRVLVSNAVSLPVDSFIFGTLAFVLFPLLFGGTAMSFTAAMTLVSGQILYKAAVTLVSMPGIYLVKETPGIVVLTL